MVEEHRQEGRRDWGGELSGLWGERVEKLKVVMRQGIGDCILSPRHVLGPELERNVSLKEDQAP